MRWTVIGGAERLGPDVLAIVARPTGLQGGRIAIQQAYRVGVLRRLVEEVDGVTDVERVAAVWVNPMAADDLVERAPQCVSFEAVDGVIIASGGLGYGIKRGDAEEQRDEV